MPSKKRKAEQLAWRLTKPVLDLPPRTEDGEGMAEYMRARRKIEKVSEDPTFMLGLQKYYKDFGDFLRNYNINIPDIKAFLNMDLADFVQPKQQRKR